MTAPPRHTKYGTFYAGNMSYFVNANGLATNADMVLGRAHKALKEGGMWESTLLVHLSDNGGNYHPLWHLQHPSSISRPSGIAVGNNWPLRGAKKSAFEGGVRIPAFVAGGWVPPRKRGTALSGYLHLADWFTTLVSLGGGAVQDPQDSSDVPGVDGLDMWGWLSGEQTTSPRNSMLLGLHLVPAGDNPPQAALINGSWKLILGQQSCMQGQWVDELFPPSTLAWEQATGAGCDVETDTWLFDIDADPTERNNLAASKPDLLRAMRSLMREEAATAIQYAGQGGVFEMWPFFQRHCLPHLKLVLPVLDCSLADRSQWHTCARPKPPLLFLPPFKSSGRSKRPK